MSEIKMMGVMRSSGFSPNHIGNDAIIMNLVADQLRKRGCEFVVLSEDQFSAIDDIDAPVIAAMCREPRNIERLQNLEDEGHIVVNSGYGIANCTRQRMARILEVASIPTPATIVVDTDEVVKNRLVKAGGGGYWVKRADIHTRHREDVAFARHPQEAQEIIQEFFLRGIKKAIICKNMEGELIKFYGVSGMNFFHWLDPSDAGYPRISMRSEPKSVASFDVEALRKLCAHASEALDVKVYGGDCIVGPDGRLTLINFNDWPSFAPCRAEAASAIARYLFKLAKDRLQML